MAPSPSVFVEQIPGPHRRLLFSGLEGVWRGLGLPCAPADLKLPSESRNMSDREGLSVN